MGLDSGARSAPAPRSWRQKLGYVLVRAASKTAKIFREKCRETKIWNHVVFLESRRIGATRERASSTEGQRDTPGLTAPHEEGSPHPHGAHVDLIHVHERHLGGCGGHTRVSTRASGGTTHRTDHCNPIRRDAIKILSQVYVSFCQRVWELLPSLLIPVLLEMTSFDFEGNAVPLR